MLDKLPKHVQPQAKSMIHETWQADTRDAADQAFDRFLSTFGAKYPQATEALAKDRNQLLAFYAFPATHWQGAKVGQPCSRRTIQGAPAA